MTINKRPFTAGLPTKEYERRYYQEHIEHERAMHRKYYYDHRDERLVYWKRHEMQRKIKVLTHYGNGKCVCVRCSYDKLAALTIDHIYNDGYKEKQHGHGFYRKLELSGFPSGYQTLCMNCQYVKREEYENNKTL